LGASTSRNLVLSHRGVVTPVTPVGIVIGRSTSCTVMLDDASVSRRHARIALVEGEAVLQDLKSANGVWVNGNRIDGTHRLREGDVIIIGPRVFRLQLGDATDATLAPGAHASIDDLWSEGRPPYAETSTEYHDALALADRGADELFREGRSEEGVAVLEPQLMALLERTRASRMLTESAERGATTALALARRTLAVRWIDYVFDLYECCDEVPPRALVDELPRTFQALGVRRLASLERFLKHFESREAELDPPSLDGIARLSALAGRERRPTVR
jgi:predicted component of type VI protein secretion system